MSKQILYHSTNGKAKPVSFREALIKGLAPDGGLYMPSHIPSFTKEEIAAMQKMKYDEIAYQVGKKFLADEIPDDNLLNIVKSAYNFEVPLEKVTERKYILRLDQGPTASFKDFAARMMGRLMQYYLKKENRSMLILTATSGDTGSAIANAFYGLDNINVVILYPEKEVTDRQRKQMTTLKKNIHIIALDGKFDDCQAMVKKAFSDPSLDELGLSSANSINIGRLIPQSMYYFYSFAQLTNGKPDDKAIFSVPSGNFGDLMGGLIAMKMGLPVKKFVIATNENDEVPKFFDSGIYKIIAPSLNCISCAMNVGHPSNMARIISLYGGIMDEKGVIHQEPNVASMNKDLFAIGIDDGKTKETMKKAFAEYKLLLEPHGSVSWAGLTEYLQFHPADNKAGQLCISLETAHPAKFPKEINELLNIDPELPDSLKGLDGKEESFTKMKDDYDTFKKFLKKNY
jgi:threonine synthase